MATPIPQRPTGTSDDGVGAGKASPTKPAVSTSSGALYNLRVLAALRSGNPAEVQPYLDALNGGQHVEATAGQLLGMAVRVSPAAIITLILRSPNVSSPNLPVGPNTTTTALHVASEHGRADAVALLLSDPRTDDSIRDEKGRTALECASTPEVAAVIEDSRAIMQQEFLGHLDRYVSSNLSSVDESANIVAFLEKPRAGSVDLGALDERTGTTLLHEAARRRDLRLVELAVKRGADVFVRDRRNRRILEGDKGADERIKAYLRQFNNKDSMVQMKSDGRPPDLKGFLSKWVNYRSGWRTRWFVLENGVLSYYRNREDELIACRGSIALATARLHQSADGLRFEVSSAASSSVPKMSVKSSQRAEVARWVQAIKLNLDFYQKSKTAKANQASSVDRSDTRSTKSSIRTTAPSTGREIGAALNELPPLDQALGANLKRTPTAISGISAPGTVRSSRSRNPSAPVRKRSQSPSGNSTASGDLNNSDGISNDGSIRQQSDTVPFESEFELGMLNLKAQLELTEQLVGSVVTPSSSPSLDVTRGSSSRQQQVKEALRESIATVTGLVERQHYMVQDRERYFLNRIKREVQARRLWEENLMAVAQQQAETDRHLAEAAKDNERKRRALRQARTVLAELSLSQPTSPQLTGVDATVASVTTPDAHLGHVDFAPTLDLPPSTQRASSRGSLTRQSMSLRRASLSYNHRNSISRRQSVSIQDIDQVVAAMDESEDEDDEFFDAIETGTIPNLRTYDQIEHVAERPETPLPPYSRGQLAASAQPQPGTIENLLARKSLEPYNHVRSKLPIDDDKRPSVSLWSILKSSIGKDLTKISFPVSFNECTSMLQRMAEDMEYDACLTVAAERQDSLKRIAFVGAFAMSNYSSTIGRIAKPFNPMLSQSFEYAIPNRYRYISEQVSHHPPISACYCEAPKWKYYGEVDAKNKFQGRYFEIRPTGVAHAELIIPREWVKGDYPSAGPEYPEDMVVEHYSWKKVITNVSNFIMGNPIIDHYGDLVVTNHRTGETCTLTFKPRGWRGKDAFEIKGDVRDALGNEQWEIAGRWDKQLVARQVGAANKPLDVDESIDEAAPEYLLLWQNTEKPKAPFNLTPYACTLNDIPKGLEEYIPPTDCRLRTDQRAFENAEYDKAQLLKSANEEKQRETRKLRAEGRLPQHEPRWFVPETDQDSGERVWQPKRADDGEVRYWHDREEQGRKSPSSKWADVDHIFVEA